MSSGATEAVISMTQGRSKEVEPGSREAQVKKEDQLISEEGERKPETTKSDATT